jgi:antitoxin VapB
MVYTTDTYREEVVMASTAKLFMTGRSQAVRLPKEFRFPGTEVDIRRDPGTGDVVLSPRPDSWDDFFALADATGVPPDFMADRDRSAAPERDL